MVGVILCGGQCSRMGSDKGLLISNTKTWAQISFEKLSSLQIPIKFSINEQQLAAYKKIFKEDFLIVDNNLLEVKGPLLGVLSAHEMNCNADLFILACDLLLIEPTLLKELFDLYKNNNQYEVFIFTNENQPEPLCGIYTNKAIKKIINLQKNDKLLKHSMKFVLSQLNVCSAPIKNMHIQSFKNFNADTDLIGI
jgi:molybdopterin-guanine dinucleotide biosynthesis protein A